MNEPSECPGPVDERDEYIMDEIIGDCKVWNKQKYLVKWKGWPQDNATWEPEKHISNSTALDIYQANCAEAAKEKSTK